MVKTVFSPFLVSPSAPGMIDGTIQNGFVWSSKGPGANCDFKRK